MVKVPITVCATPQRTLEVYARTTPDTIQGHNTHMTRDPQPATLSPQPASWLSFEAHLKGSREDRLCPSSSR
jgi:hypothetical protein